MVGMDDVGEIFELTAIDLLVGPSEMIAGGNWGVFWIFHQEFSLNIVNDRGGEENAHRALTASKQVELFLFWHWGATFATGKNDGLASFWDSELALEFSSGGKERGYAGGDMIRHSLAIEECHLFLYGTKDAGVASV